MVNKKGYIKTIEAVIAIVLILVFIVSIWPKSQDIEIKTPRDISLTLDRTLNEFQYNNEYRECIIEMNIPNNGLRLVDIPDSSDEDLKDCYNSLNTFIDDVIPQAMLYSLSICSVGNNNDCIPPDIEIMVLPKKENIYTKGVFISTTPEDTDSDSKTIKIYIWRKA